MFLFGWALLFLQISSGVLRHHLCFSPAHYRELSFSRDVLRHPLRLRPVTHTQVVSSDTASSFVVSTTAGAHEPVSEFLLCFEAKFGFEERSKFMGSFDV